MMRITLQLPHRTHKQRGLSVRLLAAAVTAALITAGTSQSADAASYVVLSNGNQLSASALSKLQAAGGTVRANLPQIGVAIIEADEGFQARAGRVGGVRSITADMQLQLISPVEMQGVDAQAANPPTSGDDDFYFDLQWGHDAVQAPEAWALGARGAGVRVAVLDSGIDAEHPDLAPNLNTALSRSFVPGEDWNIQPGFYFNHGTHVAGTIAAADNGYGIIGVAPEAELVAVKVLSEYTGSGSFGGIIQGIVYAADINADIVNMSLGADIPHNVPGAAELFVAAGRATNYAHQKGTLLVAAAGNDGRDLDHDASLKSFPAELPHVLSIAATAPLGWATGTSPSLDFPASYTNYGQSGIDFAAPGGDAAYPGNELCIAGPVVQRCWVMDLVFSTISGGWSWTAGTSMAAPHVSGVAALVIGANGGDMSPAAVERALRQGADDLGKPGNDDYYGAGRVNAVRSLGR